jgi:uncharacterized membrane protein YfcA
VHPLSGSVVLFLLLAPGLPVGPWLSGRVAQALDERWLRPAVLAFGALSGALVLVHGLLGG